MVKTEHETFKSILKDNAHQITRARIIIFELLLGSTPLTLTELITAAGSQVDRVSIYRNVELFERLGIVKRIYLGFKYKIELSDLFTDHHHHLICISCDEIINIQDERYIDTFITGVSSPLGFMPLRHQFEIEGYCANCFAKQKQ